MLVKINGLCYKNMIQYGVQNLNRHMEIVNKLNVFPVPDGDTGTNMVMTITSGLHSIRDTADDLPSVSKKFANAVVFGARGNSGVIVSQFLKGVSECFAAVDEVDCPMFLKALEHGVALAHSAVSKPVDGTILTVLKDATDAVKAEIGNMHSIDDVITAFLSRARISLEHTPDLLPVLKDAGVVDSGGAGVVYFFEGVKKYLDGEEIPAEQAEVAPAQEFVDYTAFNSGSSFRYGYCTELLIQHLDGHDPFDCNTVRTALEKLGDSLVISCEEDKMRIHVHTFFPEQVLAYCHRFGEFLNLKIENMSVQHTQNGPHIVCTNANSDSSFAIVAVASDNLLQKVFSDMGADAVIVTDKNPSSQDYIEAFDAVDKSEILVFPNSSNSILAAMQATSLYKGKKITVLNCRSIAECYASLAIIDFGETDIKFIVDRINETIHNVYTVSIARSIKTMTYGNRKIEEGDVLAMHGNDLLVAGKSFANVVCGAVDKVMLEDEKNVLTIFYSKNASDEQLDSIVERIGKAYLYLEIYTVPTEDKVFDLLISFE